MEKLIVGTEYREASCHWICKDCETLNHNSRNFCLCCGDLRSKVQLKDEIRLQELRNDFWGKNFYDSKKNNDKKKRGPGQPTTYSGI